MKREKIGFSPHACRLLLVQHAVNRGARCQEVARRQGQHLDAANWKIKKKKVQKKIFQKKKKRSVSSSSSSSSISSDEEKEEEGKRIKRRREGAEESEEEITSARSTRQCRRNRGGGSGGGGDGGRGGVEERGVIVWGCGLVDQPLSKSKRDENNPDNWYLQNNSPPKAYYITKYHPETRMYTVGKFGGCVVF